MYDIKYAMKKFAIIFFGFILILSSCNKDEEGDDPADQSMTPVQEQWGLAINYTATWCGPCGNWGAPLIHELSDAGNVVAITVHTSGDPMYHANLYASFNADRPVGGGIPSFWIGDKKSNIVGYMETLLQQTPIAGMALEHTKTDSTMTVKTKTAFFSEGSGKFFLSVLILENGIDGSESAGDYKQNGVIDPAIYKHDFVLRASSIGDNSYGEEIVANPAKGTAVEKAYTIPINPAWGPQLYPVAILWHVDLSGDPNFQFVNAIK